MADDTPKQPPASAPARFDPWSGQRLRGLRFFAVSTAVHAGILVLLGTITLTIAHKVEQIKVTVVDDQVGPEQLDGEASLQDLAGVLNVQRAAPQQARPRGPVVQNVRAPEMPRIAGLGPKLGAGPTIDTISTNLSFGSGAIGGLGGGFGDYVGGLRKVGLDIALVIDTTDSMQFVIDDVKAKLTQLVTTMQKMVPTARIGIVVYRDHGDEYIVKWSDLSFRTEKLREFLSHITADGGGDWEEAVKEGMDAAMKELSWRKQSKKIIILVGGSPPHPEDVDDVHAMVRKWHDQGGFVSTVDVTKKMHEEFDRALWKSLHGKQPYEPSPMPEFYKQTSEVFGEMAKEGGGELIELDAQKALMKEVVVLTFGSRWKVEMAKFLGELS
ncbi:MAG TPA: vWA domain-containing protein [Candidatus Kryptonia bacterium]|nr:vWA domain-containing protein [Candidatus Kryptonia bacterium]